MPIINEENKKHYLKWCELQITICSGALGAFLFKYNEAQSAPLCIKFAACAFFVSMFFHFLTCLSLIQNSPHEDWLSKVAWATFLLGFGLVFLQIFSS